MYDLGHLIRIGVKHQRKYAVVSADKVVVFVMHNGQVFMSSLIINGVDTYEVDGTVRKNNWKLFLRMNAACCTLKAATLFVISTI